MPGEKTQKLGEKDVNFVNREKARNAKLIVAMSGNSTKITNPEVSHVYVRNDHQIQNCISLDR